MDEHLAELIYLYSSNTSRVKGIPIFDDKFWSQKNLIGEKTSTDVGNFGIEFSSSVSSEEQFLDSIKELIENHSKDS